MSHVLHFLRTEYWGSPWYQGAVWGNLFVVPVLFVLGVVLWPPLRRAIHRAVDRKLAAVHERLGETQRRLDHLILHLPDVPPLQETGRANGPPSPSKRSR